jgi:hypothetical protein
MLNRTVVVLACLAALAGEASATTIRGAVFYNDRRSHGLWSTRRTTSGALGSMCNSSGRRADGSACSTNWLGAYYAVVDVIERDEGYGIFDVSCESEDIVKSVAINADGSFVATFDHDDPCHHDDLGLAIVLKVRLRYCGSWCFSVNTEGGTPYALFYPGATPGDPLLVDANDDVQMSNMFFNPAGTSTTVANDTSKAVNYYASLVDTIRTVHEGTGIPFYEDEFGEIEYIYPSNRTATATAKSPTEVVISPTLDAGWPDGRTPAHEYGHILMQRAWDGDYGFDGVGISAGDSAPAPSRQIAFKEGWAEFIEMATFAATAGCQLASFDDNARTAPTGPLGEGAQWRINIKKALCDWYDARNDDDLALAGAGDHFAADDLYSMWFNLRNMYLRAGDYGGDYSGEGLWFCDWVDYYLDVRKSSAAVGAARHEDYVETITDLVYNNNIACYLPAP